MKPRSRWEPSREGEPRLRPDRLTRWPGAGVPGRPTPARQDRSGVDRRWRGGPLLGPAGQAGRQVGQGAPRGPRGARRRGVHRHVGWSGRVVTSGKGEVRIEELSAAQRTIARRAAEARATVPDLELRADVEMTRSLEL